MINAGGSWESILALFAGMFSSPSFRIFQEIVQGWVLCPGRRTVTHMIDTMIPKPRRAHDAYHRFIREAAWSLTKLWATSTCWLVQSFAARGVIQLDIDDTLFHKTGRKVDGAGNYRDPVRSTTKKIVYALGLNLVVVTLRIAPPWGGEPLGLPINVRLYRKGGPTRLKLAEEAIREIIEWLPGRILSVCFDGAYASLAGRFTPDQVRITSRLRRDAAIYGLPAAKASPSRGRPRVKGDRLPSPQDLASQMQAEQWRLETVNVRGQLVEKFIASREVIWNQVTKKPILLVIVRDPNEKENNDFFFTTNLEASPSEIASIYAGRWSIEDTNRNVKQYLGGEDPQTWKGKGPERAAALSMWLYSMIWAWYLIEFGDNPSWTPKPWYRSKRTPSFVDALAALRRNLWWKGINAGSADQQDLSKIIGPLLEALAHAA